MNALIFLIETFSRLYMLTFLLRIMLQLARADFYNPISQFVVQITNPLVVPARRIIPSLRGFDMPTLVVLYLLQIAFSVLIFVLRGFLPSIGQLLVIALFELLNAAVWAYVICIFAYVLLSWFGQAYNPIAVFMNQIVEPLLRPARRLLPHVGGLDLSPMIVIIFLMAALIAVGDLQSMMLS
ncbi:MAG TPA: YggT family protein [Gammaproteobacteria bacterium]